MTSSTVGGRSIEWPGRARTQHPPAPTRVSIVDPNKEIAKGYKANVMPLTYGTRLSAKQIDALTHYIYRSTNTKARSQGK